MAFWTAALKTALAFKKAGDEERTKYRSKYGNDDSGSSFRSELERKREKRKKHWSDILGGQ